MAESTLALSNDDLVAEVGIFAGFGRGAKFADPAFTTQQQAALDSAVRSGLRQFYFPPPLEGVTTTVYDWSFLRPAATLALAAGASTIPLPDDFGGFEGEITLTTSAGMTWWPVKLFNEGQVREQFQATPQRTGRPIMAALQPLKGTTGTQGQRQQLVIFPLADTAYSLQFQYYLLPDRLDGSFPYPLGGAAHAETILASCKYAWERDQDDLPNGPQRQNWIGRLAASIGMDRKNKPQVLGYNGDRSDRRSNRCWQHYNDRVLFSGVQY